MSRYGQIREPRTLSDVLKDEPYVEAGEDLGRATELEHITRAVERIRQSYEKSVALTDRRRFVEKAFEMYAQLWRDDSTYASSIGDMIQHPAYQAIISLGDEAVPLLLRELERRPDHWFAVLTAITHENPIRPEEEGDIGLMSRAWLRWAEARRIW